MTPEERELDQLILVALSYLRQARRLVCWRRKSAQKPVSEINLQRQPGKLQCAERLLAHSTSAAIRLSTISDLLESNGKGKRLARYTNRFYTWQGSGKQRALTRKSSSAQIIAEIKQTLDEHIHDLLRDDVGHVENERPDASDRRAILDGLTPLRIIRELDSCASKLEAKVRAKLSPSA